MISFGEELRAGIEANLREHDRVTLELGDRRHAAVAIVICDSDPEDDYEPIPAGAIDLSGVPGGGRSASGKPLDGRMVGVAGGASFLLCRRAVGMRRHAGQWALPGGRLDEGEQPIDAALRELEEELNLSLGPENVIGWLDDYATRSGFVMSPVVLWAGDGDGKGGGRVEIDPDPNEVYAAYRIGLHALQAGEPRLIDIPESDMPVLQLPIGNDLIHAPTGAILLQLRQVALLGNHGERVDHYEEPVFAWR